MPPLWPMALQLLPVYVAGETTFVVATSVASPSSAATKSSKKTKLFAAVAFPAAMADRTGNALLPPAPDLLTTALKKVPRRVTILLLLLDMGPLMLPSHPNRGIPPIVLLGRKTSTAVGASSHSVQIGGCHVLQD